MSKPIDEETVILAMLDRPSSYLWGASELVPNGIGGIAVECEFSELSPEIRSFNYDQWREIARRAIDAIERVRS